MGKERFKRDSSDSFYGRFLYEQVVPKDHFLVKLNELIPWQRFTYKLVKYYKGKAKEGRPPYDPALILKMLLVSYLYDISERQTEEMANLSHRDPLRKPGGEIFPGLRGVLTGSRGKGHKDGSG